MKRLRNLLGRPADARRNRGFTLIEVVIAGAISAMVVAAALAALVFSQRAAANQARATEVAGRARIAMEIIGRDIRSAGDSVDLLAAHCLGGAASPGAPFGCPAILEPHPWRITIARNSWGAGPDGILHTVDDTLPILGFTENGENVVAYQFVPDGGLRTFGPGHEGYIGRIERIVDPFGFDDGPRKSVLLDQVVLDNRMRVDPADPTSSDPRFDHALFLYRLLSTENGEFRGASEIVARTSRTGAFLLPPARFFPIPDPADWPVDWPDVAPWLPTYEQSFVGTQAMGEAPITSGGLRPGSTFDADLRFVLDFNRIRAVRVQFKVADAERPGYEGGIDLDPAQPGTADVQSFESAFELKSFAGVVE